MLFMDQITIYFCLESDARRALDNIMISVNAHDILKDSECEPFESKREQWPSL